MKVAVLGYGTVGSGIVEVLENHQERIIKRLGQSLELSYILDNRDFPNHYNKNKLIKDMNVILEDSEVKVVAEAMGGIHPAYDYVKAALEKGKSVVTSNKELVALHGPTLLELAKEKKVNFLFEGSVGGGIPLIRPFNNGLTADELTEITGILNGTTNFILTKMKNEGRSFDDVLKEAQALGYAERNPEADVEGYDACRKIAILASLAFGEHVDYQEIETKGITGITVEDMEDADHIGHTIKLLASCKKQEDQIFISVEPTMIPKAHPLASIDDVFNAVFIKGDVVDDVMFYGRGAGKMPTASAMVADMIDAARHEGIHIHTLWGREKIALTSREALKTRYYVRLEDKETYHETVMKELFGEVETVQNERGYSFITPLDEIGVLDYKLSALEGCTIQSKIRIEL